MNIIVILSEKWKFLILLIPHGEWNVFLLSKYNKQCFHCKNKCITWNILIIWWRHHQLGEGRYATYCIAKKSVSFA
jgi:hypothetical protein